MPNNSTARRGKEKKSKEKNKRDSKETDTPLLPKEDTASADSGTLSLSSAGKDKEMETAACNLEKLQEKALVIWHEEKAKLNAGNSPSLSSKVQKEKQHTPLVQKEKWHTPLADKELAQALGKMEEAILKHDTGEAGEPDWEDADLAWAKLVLRVQHQQALGVDERTKIRRNIREALRERNQLISRAELISQSDLALTMIELEWWKGTADGIAAGKAESSAGSTARAPPPVVIRRDEQGGGSVEDQAMLDHHWHLCLRLEYSRTLTLDERTEMRRHVRIEHPGASEEEIKVIYAERLMERALTAHSLALAKKLQADKDALSPKENPLVRGPAQTALLNEFALSLENKRAEIYAEVREANPTAGASELGSLLRAAKVQKALAWRRKKNQGRKDASLSSSGTARLTEPLSLEAQPKTGGSTTG